MHLQVFSQKTKKHQSMTKFTCFILLLVLTSTIVKGQNKDLNKIEFYLKNVNYTKVCELSTKLI
jgi:hypothetical protein